MRGAVCSVAHLTASTTRFVKAPTSVVPDLMRRGRVFRSAGTRHLGPTIAVAWVPSQPRLAVEGSSRAWGGIHQVLDMAQRCGAGAPSFSP